MPGRPFRFLHTADWQMGMKAAGLGQAAEAVRQARLAAAERVLAVAARHGVACIVIAGDVFEDNGVDPLLVQQVADILGRSACPVFILPGNHDPLVAGSVYDREVWKRTKQVTVWRAREPYPLRDDVICFPCPYLSRSTREESTSWIPPREPGDASLRIGVAHGALRGLTASEDESACPIDPHAATRHGLDYLALGHWHSTFLYPDGPEAATAYAGSPETTKFGERDSGNVLVVELPGPGCPPRIVPVHTGGLVWRQEARDIGSLADCEALLQAFDREDPSQAGRTLLELTLRGVAPAEAIARIQNDLEPLLRVRFHFARLALDGLSLEPTEAELLAIAPAGPVQEACARLLQMARTTGDARERTVARLALAELYALSREVTA